MGEVGVCTRLHSWGRLRAPPGAYVHTPTQKHPGNGLPPAPPLLEGQHTAAAGGSRETTWGAPLWSHVVCREWAPKKRGPACLVLGILWASINLGSAEAI